MILAVDIIGLRQVFHAVLIGFCMGGAFAMKARPGGRFDRIVSFYGMIHPAWAGPQQADPLARVSAVPEVPLLALLGENDELVPRADVEELERTTATVVRYAGAGHAFAHDPNSELHQPDATADAWGRATDFVYGGTVRSGRWDAQAMGCASARATKAVPA